MPRFLPILALLGAFFVIFAAAHEGHNHEHDHDDDNTIQSECMPPFALASPSFVA